MRSKASAASRCCDLIQDRQPWSQVRFWLYDLAREISAAEKDGTLPPVLALDRVWITGDGRAKLLDFPAPGLATAGLQQAGAAPAAPPLPETGRTQRFLGEVAVAALEGRADAAAKTAGEAAVPLPLHARNFLKSLPQLSDADAVAGALKPLLQRVTSVSRWRRAAVVAGCVAFPVLDEFCSCSRHGHDPTELSGHHGTFLCCCSSGRRMSWAQERTARRTTPGMRKDHH